MAPNVTRKLWRRELCQSFNVWSVVLANMLVLNNLAFAEVLPL